MAFDPTKQSYTNAQNNLDQAYNSRNMNPRVIDGSCQVVYNVKYLKPPVPKLNSGIAIHNDAFATLETLNKSLPLTTQLLERTKGLGTTWSLQPKGPSPIIEKKFESFIKALAAQKGCSVDHLKQLGYQCSVVANVGLSIEFPDKDQANLFKQMLNEELNPSLLLDNNSDKQEKDDEEEYLNRMRP